MQKTHNSSLPEKSLSLRMFSYSCYDLLMKEQTPLSKPIKPTYRFHPPDIHMHLRCDFRKDLDTGMTLKQIAAKYHCDQRTVRTCILLNRSSTELGKQYAPTKLQPYMNLIQELYQSENEHSGSVHAGILQISRKITALLSELGYTGSERTVRNYIRSHCIPIPEQNDSKKSDSV